ncbi:MAG: hypothetical protein LBC94_09655 [Desulfovibrio sp.]|jgi:hypothetical protein|nr:hypothetical protein [Desulfovibrio sp.]
MYYGEDDMICLNCEHAVKDNCRHWRGDEGSCEDFWPDADFLAEVREREDILTDQLAESRMWGQPAGQARHVA